MLVAVESSFRPAAYRFGDEVVTADEATVVDIEGLLPAMGVDFWRKCGL